MLEKKAKFLEKKFKDEKTKISPWNFYMQNVDLEIQSLHS